ncbi:riboflavin synthase [Chitinophagaceae bacterium LWZ2-11]
MFTGIIESTGKIESIENQGSNRIFWINSPISEQLKIDQSVSHDGVCLTVDALKQGSHRVTAIEETLRKTNLGDWKAGNEVNVERCMQMNGRLDGHIVQGHVDSTAVCIETKTFEGSYEYTFEFSEEFSALVIEKGSITVNGTSLTCFNIGRNTFTVAIIPYTYEHTNIKSVTKGSVVNIEFDVIGKYIQRRQEVEGWKK